MLTFPTTVLVSLALAASGAARAAPDSAVLAQQPLLRAHDAQSIGRSLGHGQAAHRMKRSLTRRVAQALKLATLPVAANTTVFNSTAFWFQETGNVGACLTNRTDADLTFGLSTLLWDDSKGVLSPLCGQQVVVTNLANGKNVTAIVGDVSADQNSLLSLAAFEAIADLSVGVIDIQYTFPGNGTAVTTLASLPTATDTLGEGSPLETAVPVFVQPTPAPAPAPTPAPAPAFDAAAAKKSSEQAAREAAASSASSIAAAAAQSASDVAAAASASSVAAAAAATPTPPPAPAPAPKAPKPAPAPAPAPNNGNGGGGQTFSGGIATFFTQNGVAGACGTVHQDTDFVIAIDSAMYANGAKCGRTITITRSDNGKSVTGVVADECPTCDNGTSLDLSTGMFNSLGSPDEGIFKMTWKFN